MEKLKLVVFLVVLLLLLFFCFVFFQCGEWGFLLLELFGATLGTGDYGHLTVEHVPMLFRTHRSLHHLSNQGFEVAETTLC